MSGRMNRINDALANSSVELIVSVEPLAGTVKHVCTGTEYGAKTFSRWMQGLYEASDDSEAIKKLERTLANDERLRAVTLRREAFDALNPK